MVSEASLRALDACCSPWASITWDKMEINNQNSVLLIITLAIINLRISPPDKTVALRLLKCLKLNSSSNFSVITFCGSARNA